MEKAWNGSSQPAADSGWVARLFHSESYTPEYQQLKFSLHHQLLERINLEALSSMAGERARTEIKSALIRLVDEEKTPLSLMEKDRVVEEVLDEVFGLGPLEPLLRDPTISDILVTTPKLVYVEQAGKLHRTPVQFKDNAHLLRIIEKIVAQVGRRVNAPIPPVAVDGPLLSIRRFGRQALRGEDLVRSLTITEDMRMLLEAS